MAKFNILRDALRKYRIGLLNLEEVVMIFRRAEEKMTKYTDNFESYRNKLRKYESKKLKNYQNIVFAVNNTIEKRAFEEAILLISDGKGLRQQIDEGLNAIEAFNVASNLLKTLKLEINAKWLNKMPTILILDRMLEEADKLMLEGKYLQAEVLIKFCAVETKKTKDNNKHEQNHDFKDILSKKIEELTLVCKRTKAYTKFCQNEVFQIDGRVEIMLYTFIEECQFNLVKKLVRDLNFVLKNRISFRDRLIAFPEIEKSAQLEIKNAIKKEGWVGGANCILSLSMKVFSGKMIETEKKLDEVQFGYLKKN